MNYDDLYKKNETKWMEKMIVILKENRLSELDTGNLMDLLNELAGRDKREMKSRFRVLVQHLLKYCFQPSKRSSSWEITIVEQRATLWDDFFGPKGNKKYWKKEYDQNADSIYDLARKLAAKEMKVKIERLPKENPWTFDQILDDGFWPESCSKN